MTIVHCTPAVAPLLSIVVISRNDPRLLACLQSVNALQNAPQIELVVLLDRSAPSYTQQVYTLVQDFCLPVVLAHMETGKGIADARNQGAALARSNMLVYIDSDCTMQADFIKEIRPLLDNPIITGKVVFLPRSSSWMSWHNSAVRALEYDEIFRHYVRSPNLCIRKDVLELVGGYEPGIPGDDFVLNQKCYLAGYHPVYCERLIIFHNDDETIRKTIRTWFSYGIGNAYRLKRERHLFGKEDSKLPVTFTTHMQKPAFSCRFFVWIRSAIINAGFFYGRWYWRNTDVSLTFTPVSSSGREYNRYSSSRHCVKEEAS